ncbi:hypothetical protein CAPTEDRAFT_205803 [Capitella teleta]|uniref:CCHC-type domain-containing protein n=1 Tax=Capitella teleta TaxID=283909 RepID=R7UCW0_CAPTE|nr:hypothetical protein CAPTEDRAFT_205803 [Capitella teleta]|eukprot:ELU03829.1 hypothetical protein CAPTEDRAFT_205803 [Capitella teleta]
MRAILLLCSQLVQQQSDLNNRLIRMPESETQTSPESLIYTNNIENANNEDSNIASCNAGLEYDSFTGPQANETIRVKPEANGRRIRINEFTLESDEGDTESDLEINRDEQDALKFFSAIADVLATERFIKRVGFCDGDKPSRTLKWLRAIDHLPDNIQVEIALQTAESTIHSSLRELKNAKWPKIKTLLANRYVNANFSEAQKEALDRLEQRPGEGLYNYITTFEVLLNEAYQALQLDQRSLIRTFLSRLSDRDMAKSVARKKLRTLPEVVKEVRRHYQDDDLLRPPKISKVHAIDKYENPQVSALSVVVTNLVNMQKETNAQIAALAKIETKPTPKSNYSCFRCGKPGHFSRECRTKNTSVPPVKTMHQNASEQTCHRCRVIHLRIVELDRRGHLVIVAETIGYLIAPRNPKLSLSRKTR